MKFAYNDDLKDFIDAVLPGDQDDEDDE